MEKILKDKYIDEIYFSIVEAILVVMYFLAFNLLYLRVSKESFDFLINIITMAFLFATIYLFEKAYKKDSEKIALQSIEMLVLTTHTLTIRYITEKLNLPFQNYVLTSSYFFAIYFVLKAIILYTKGKKEESDSLSDIREIVKDEPIKKEAKKRTRV